MTWQWWLAAGVGLLEILALIHALLHVRTPQAALGWCAAIATLPLVGTLAYFLFGINRVDSRAAKLMSEVLIRRALRWRVSHVFARLEQVPPRFSLDDHPIIRVGEGKPSSVFRTGGNHLDPLFNGDEAYPAMLQAIREARREVFLCTYIFEGPVYGEAFADALLAAHQRGADVRVVVDGLGTLFSRSKPWKRLQKAGVPLYRFIPPRLFPPQMLINLRNHRKVLICDDIAFTGGMNLADAHVLGSASDNHVQDLHFRCAGPVVRLLREAFLMDWAFVAEKDERSEFLEIQAAGDMDCRVILDGPGSPTDPLQDLLCGVISCARRDITVFTPYFLPPREMISAFTSAVARGVEVRIILPAELDHPYVAWAGARSMQPLLESGVRIFFQPPPFAHTKLFLVDNLYTCLGSVNLDPRSLSLNFELNVEVFAPELNARMREYANAVLERSREISLAELLRKPLLVKLRNAATWIFSPYM